MGLAQFDNLLDATRRAQLQHDKKGLVANLPGRPTEGGILSAEVGYVFSARCTVLEVTRQGVNTRMLFKRFSARAAGCALLLAVCIAVS